MAHEIADGVPRDNPGAREIGFAIPERYNASRVLFDNLAKGNGERTALIGPAGTHTYKQLCAEASRWGNGFVALGTIRRVLAVFAVCGNVHDQTVHFLDSRAHFVQISSLHRPEVTAPRFDLVDVELRGHVCREIPDVHLTGRGIRRVQSGDEIAERIRRDGETFARGRRKSYRRTGLRPQRL